MGNARFSNRFISRSDLVPHHMFYHRDAVVLNQNNLHAILKREGFRIENGGLGRERKCQGKQEKNDVAHTNLNNSYPRECGDSTFCPTVLGMTNVIKDVAWNYDQTRASHIYVILRNQMRLREGHLLCVQ